MKYLALGAYLVLVAAVLFVGCSIGEEQQPACPTCPLPVQPTPQPPKPRSPWGEFGAPVGAWDYSWQSKGPDGTEPQIDYPAEQWIRNTGGSDGAGLCVASSFEMACRWAGIEEMRGFRKWCEQFPGGSYAEKLDRQVTEFCRKKGIPKPKFWQYEGSDTALYDTALKTGRLVCCTLYISKRYGGRISHMVCGAHSDSRGVYSILDNNMMRGDSNPPYEWFMSRADFVRACGGGGRMWFVALAKPGCPPSPRN